MQIEIVHESGHYVGYVGGEFYCTGDTYGEVQREIELDLISNE